MLNIDSRTRLQLVVFAPAIFLMAASSIDAVLHWLHPSLPPMLLNGLAWLYVGAVHLAAPGDLVLAVASRKRNHSLRTLRWIGAGWVVVALLMMASHADKFLQGHA